MLEFLSPHSDVDAINLLKKDHDTVKELFDQFENSDSRPEKKKIVAKAIMELKIHAAIEEDIFYPAVRKQMENDKDDIMNEADEEHHVAKVLIAELDEMSGTEEHFDAKFHVLSENVRHHIKEEEGKMFPEARALKIDYDALGGQLLDKKKELKKDGVPPAAEEKMVKRGGMATDSPAMTAKRMAGKKARKAIKIRHPKVTMKRGKKSAQGGRHRRKAA